MHRREAEFRIVVPRVVMAWQGEGDEEGGFTGNCPAEARAVPDAGGFGLAAVLQSRHVAGDQRNQQVCIPKFGRQATTEAGLAVRVNIHPRVKVIIFPTSFSVVPSLRLTGRAVSADTPAGRLWGWK